MIAYASIMLIIAAVVGMLTGLFSGSGRKAFGAFGAACLAFAFPPMMSRASKAKEIRATQYVVLARLRDDDPSLAPAIAKAMADRKVTLDEYQDIDRISRLHELEKARRDLMDAGDGASGRSLQSEGL